MIGELFVVLTIETDRLYTAKSEFELCVLAGCSGVGLSGGSVELDDSVMSAIADMCVAVSFC